MINWQSVIFNSLWILGSAILLAGFSYNYWLTIAEEKSLSTLLKRQPFQSLFWISCTLISIGLIGTSTSVWETGIWALLTLISIINTIRIYGSTLSHSKIGTGDS